MGREEWKSHPEPPKWQFMVIVPLYMFCHCWEDFGFFIILIYLQADVGYLKGHLLDHPSVRPNMLSSINCSKTKAQGSWVSWFLSSISSVFFTSLFIWEGSLTALVLEAMLSREENFFSLPVPVADCVVACCLPYFWQKHVVAFLNLLCPQKRPFCWACHPSSGFPAWMDTWDCSMCIAPGADVCFSLSCAHRCLWSHPVFSCSVSVVVYWPEQWRWHNL